MNKINLNTQTKICQMVEKTINKIFFKKHSTIINKILSKHEKFLIYGLIGSLSVLLDFIIYKTLILNTDIHYQLVNFISISFGIINSFTLNTLFNFKTKDKILLRLISFYTIGLLGILISVGILYLFVEVIGLNELTSKLISLFVILIVQYFLNKNISFKKYNT